MTKGLARKPDKLGNRFAERRLSLTAISRPGEICRFDLGPAAPSEFVQSAPLAR